VCVCNGPGHLGSFDDGQSYRRPVDEAGLLFMLCSQANARYLVIQKIFLGQRGGTSLYQGDFLERQNPQYLVGGNFQIKAFQVIRTNAPLARIWQIAVGEAVRSRAPDAETGAVGYLPRTPARSDHVSGMKAVCSRRRLSPFRGLLNRVGGSPVDSFFQIRSRRARQIPSVFDSFRRQSSKTDEIRQNA